MDEQVVPKLTLPPETAAADETGLFCIDGDYTLIDGHTHNRIYGAGVLSKLIKENGANWERIYEIIKAKTHAGELRYQSKKEWKALFETVLENNMWQRLLAPDKKIREETQWELVKHLKPIGDDAERWKSLFLNLIEEGHSVAMVSFSMYGEHILPRYLHEIIGLDQGFIDQHICIVSRLPKDLTTKEGHIVEAKERTGRMNLLSEKIVFCDDDEKLLKKTCVDGGYIPVPADNAGSHIKKLLEESKKLKLPKEPTKAPSPYRSPNVSPRGENSPLNPLAALLDADASSPPPSPPPQVISPALGLLRKSPARAAMSRSSSSGCSLENSGEYNNDSLRKSLDSVRIK